MDRIFRYKNGMKAVHSYMESVRSVAIGVYVNTGSVNEDAENNGISHLIEHMLFKGTAKRSAFQIADDVDVLGAQINAFTSKSATCYYTISTFDHTEACIEILSDLFFNSVFDKGELEKEKSVVLEEISMTDDTPDEKVMEYVSETYFDGHPLAKPILGSRENVSSFTDGDIRTYMKRFYTADNVIISIAGHIKADEADRLIKKYFVNNFGGEKSEKPVFARHISKASEIVKIKDIEQANIAFAFPCYEFHHQKEMAMHVFNNIFGGGMSSRLFQKIREEMGLAYTVYSYASTYQNDGMFMIYLGTNPEQAKAATDAVYGVIDGFLKNGITEREFLSGKEQLKGGLVLGQESSGAIMKVNGKYLHGADELFDFDKLLKEIDTVTKDDIMAAAGYIFDYTKMTKAYLGRKQQ
ncbi:MAG: insulinase family protein [Clostridiales bacterium]|jgi:predicted Zn-dependent peptidase|nr:insulinase family protein [Clostridiales bacterium]